MSLSSETRALLTAKQLDLAVEVDVFNNLANIETKSSGETRKELGESLKSKLGTETDMTEEINNKVKELDSKLGIFVQLENTITRLTNIGKGYDVDFSSLNSLGDAIRDELKNAYGLSDEDFKEEK
jgi:predicted DsbA family dithiol-disulfide isomerase